MTTALQEIDSYESDTQRGKYLTFLLEDEFYGIEIRYVTEIIGMQKVSNLPQAPEYVKGIINLRGKIIPVIDMRLRFKKEAAPYTDRTCIVVINLTDITVGLIVDRVDEVITITEECLVPPPSFGGGYQSKYIKCIGKISDDIRLILDCEKLFEDEELQELNLTDD